MTVFRRELPSPNGVECGWGRQKSRFSTNIWLSDRWLMECEQQLRPSTVKFTTQTATHQWILFISITTSMDDHDEEKRTEHNLYAAVNLKRKQLMTEDCARRIVLLKLTTGRHEAPRGLSATAGLFVKFLLSVLRSRLSWQPVSFWQHVKSSDRISYRISLTYLQKSLIATHHSAFSLISSWSRCFYLRQKRGKCVCCVCLSVCLSVC